MATCDRGKGGEQGLGVRDERLSKTWKSLKHLKNSSIPSNPDRAHIYTISGAIQANYEILESLSRDRRRQIHNEDLRTELEYFSEDYDEELKMEPRPKRTREVTPPLRTRSPRVRRQREKDLTGSVTPFVRWIKEYHLPDGLKMPSHVGCYDEKGDTDNFLHLLEGTIQGELRVSEFCTRLLDDTLQILGLHEDQPISGFVHGLKARKLVEHLSTNVPSTNKGLMENTYTWIEEREVATNELRKAEEILLGQGQGTEKQRQLRSQIKEAVRSGQLSHLVKGIKKERIKTSDSHRGEKKEKTLRTNMDVFAWTRADMTGIPKTITVNGKPFHTKHKLNEYSHIKLIKQKRQSLGPNRNITTRKEVEELTRVGILQEAVHQTWVANPVMVKKRDGG
ncbi:hypothetical protein Tco_1303529 [Tanacetum coccineum]